MTYQKHMKNVIGKQEYYTNIPPILIHIANQKISNKLRISNEFNNYFTCIGRQLVETINYKWNTLYNLPFNPHSILCPTHIRTRSF